MHLLLWEILAPLTPGSPKTPFEKKKKGHRSPSKGYQTATIGNSPQQTFRRHTYLFNWNDQNACCHRDRRSLPEGDVAVFAPHDQDVFHLQDPSILPRLPAP